jgi:hypothetical protein
MTAGVLVPLPRSTSSTATLPRPIQSKPMGTGTCERNRGVATWRGRCRAAVPPPAPATGAAENVDASALSRSS